MKAPRGLKLDAALYLRGFVVDVAVSQQHVAKKMQVAVQEMQTKNQELLGG